MKERGVASFDRRLRRIERWLRRLMSACGCGAWSSALMEMECMEAETKGLREDLWRTVECEENPAERRSLPSFFLAGARVLSIAMLIVMSSVFPLSVDPDRPPVFFEDKPGDLTSSEGEILDALRQTLSGGNKGLTALYEDALAAGGDESAQTEDMELRAAAKIAPASELRRTVAKAAPAAELSRMTEETAPIKEAPASREPSADDVISLIQVGQRALRVSERAVSVYP